MNAEEIKPTGEFLIENAKGILLSDGMYYHYSEVSKLLSLYHAEKLKELLPSDEEITKEFPERNDSGERLDINIGRREGANFIIKKITGK